jgi:hypothetical protein
MKLDFNLIFDLSLTESNMIPIFLFVAQFFFFLLVVVVDDDAEWVALEQRHGNVILMFYMSKIGTKNLFPAIYHSFDSVYSVYSVIDAIKRKSRSLLLVWLVWRIEEKGNSKIKKLKN